MKKYFLFLISCFLFACTQQEQSPPYIIIDSTKVYLNPEPDKAFINEVNPDSLSSEITCPKCNFKKTETMPTEKCLIQYTCTNCKTDLHPKEGDCCVFCSYGTHKCPSKQ